MRRAAPRGVHRRRARVPALPAAGPAGHPRSPRNAPEQPGRLPGRRGRGVIDIWGRDMGNTRKFHNVAANGQVAFVVDDLASVDALGGARHRDPRQRPRRCTDQSPPNAYMSREVIRIHPRRVITWGIGPDGARAARLGRLRRRRAPRWRSRAHRPPRRGGRAVRRGGRGRRAGRRGADLPGLAGPRPGPAPERRPPLGDGVRPDREPETPPPRRRTRSSSRPSRMEELIPGSGAAMPRWSRRSRGRRPTLALLDLPGRALPARLLGPASGPRDDHPPGRRRGGGRTGERVRSGPRRGRHRRAAPRLPQPSRGGVWSPTRRCRLRIRSEGHRGRLDDPHRAGAAGGHVRRRRRRLHGDRRGERPLPAALEPPSARRAGDGRGDCRGARPLAREGHHPLELIDPSRMGPKYPAGGERSG